LLCFLLWHRFHIYLLHSDSLFSYFAASRTCVNVPCYGMISYLYTLHFEDLFSYFAAKITSETISCFRLYFMFIYVIFWKLFQLLCCQIYRWKCFFLWHDFIFVLVHVTLWRFVQLFCCQIYRWKCFFFWLIFNVYLFYILSTCSTTFLPHKCHSFLLRHTFQIRFCYILTSHTGIFLPDLQVKIVPCCGTHFMLPHLQVYISLILDIYKYWYILIKQSVILSLHSKVKMLPLVSDI
jgi:hypothetical protein